MKVTVCQLHEPPDHLELEWRRLAEHVERNGSDLVLLPEMPFHPWLARSRDFDASAWREAVERGDDGFTASVVTNPVEMRCQETVGQAMKPLKNMSPLFETEER